MQIGKNLRGTGWRVCAMKRTIICGGKPPRYKSASKLAHSKSGRKRQSAQYASLLRPTLLKPQVSYLKAQALKGGFIVKTKGGAG